MSTRQTLGTILFLTGLFYLNFSARIIFGPILPALENDLGIGHAQSGSFFLWISLGYFVTIYSSGFVSAKIGHRNTISLAALSVGGALLILARLHSLTAIQFAVFGIGLGAGLYLPSAIATITGLVRPQNWGKAVAVHEMAPNLGLIFAPLLAELFIRLWTWRSALTALGLCSLIGGALFHRFGKGGNFLGQAPGWSAIKNLFQQRTFWIMMILFSLGVGGTLGVYNMLSLTLVSESGLDRGQANALVSLSRISGLFMAFIAGWAADRIGSKKAMAFILGLSGGTTMLLGILSGIPLIIVVFIQGAVAAGFFPPGFAALSQIGRAAERNVVVSLTVPLAFVIGGGGFPFLIGYLGEITTFSSGLIIVGTFIFLGPLTIFFLKLKPGGPPNPDQ